MHSIHSLALVCRCGYLLMFCLLSRTFLCCFPNRLSAPVLCTTAVLLLHTLRYTFSAVPYVRRKRQQPDQNDLDARAYLHHPATPSAVGWLSAFAPAPDRMPLPASAVGVLILRTGSSSTYIEDAEYKIWYKIPSLAERSPFVHSDSGTRQSSTVVQLVAPPSQRNTSLVQKANFSTE